MDGNGAIYLLCVSVRTRDRQREILASIAVYSLPKPAEHVQSPDRLLAGRLARESSNSWMTEGKREEEQWKRARQCRPVPRLRPLETPEERKRGWGGATEGPRPAALMSCCRHVVLQPLDVA